MDIMSLAMVIALKNMEGLMLNILVLIGLLKILSISENPYLCSGLYAVAYTSLALFFGAGFMNVLLYGVISFALATIYFYLLDRFQDGLLYWVILVGGLAIGLV